MSRFRYSGILPIAALIIAAGCSEKSADSGATPAVVLVENSTGPGSFAPNISVGPGEQLVLSWLEPQGEDSHALRFSTYSGGNWGAASTVASGANWFANWADFPSVVPVSASLWGAHWLVRREAGGYAYDINMTLSSDGGQTWQEPMIPHTDNTDTEHGFLSMYADDDGIGMVWLDGRKYINEVTDDVVASGMTLRSATMGSDFVVRNDELVDDLICDCCQTDVALTPNGPVAVYRNRTESEIRDIYVARKIDGQWQPGIAVSDDNWEIPGCPVNGPVIQSRDELVAVTWFSAPDERAKIQVAWSVDSGGSFGSPIEVASDRQRGHVGATLLKNGDLLVSWQRRIGEANSGTELCLRRVSRDGEMGDIHVVQEADGIFAFSVPQIASTGDDIVLAWTIETDDSYAVRTAVLPINYLN